MANPNEPTNDDAERERERERGRVALWLDPSDLDWLSRRCDCAEDASEEQRERCARVRFRARAALRKVGLTDA
ncbi:hypothetical protein J5226_17190 [Lysobacter sp. K5869]|uniref:hypothetical protein n=1 Tax=Lysobacter sp. K5869 TaxID=2820808 RepID=UPI001C05EF20|nr:hypothetical protein [Lysobacter sp. K5869]QWP75344.1 hypothetical protein J5226_17190 [Lysobacter sp. K5869]